MSSENVQRMNCSHSLIVHQSEFYLTVTEYDHLRRRETRIVGFRRDYCLESEQFSCCAIIGKEPLLNSLGDMTDCRQGRVS
jgi:hypothetical protein